MCFVGTNLLWNQAGYKHLFIVNFLQSTPHINPDPAWFMDIPNDAQSV